MGDQRRVCPHCCALTPTGCDACRACGEDLRWTLGFPRLARALGSWIEQRRIAVELRCRRNGELVEILPELGAATCLHFSDGATWQCMIDEQAVELKVSASSVAHQFDLPAVQVDCSGAVISVVAKAVPNSANASTAILKFRPEEILLNTGKCVTLGRALRNDVAHLDGHEIAAEHALVVPRRRANGTEHWLFDLGTTAGTLVNRQMVIAHHLETGDLVQIGPYAWTYNQNDGRLVPIDAIEGVDVVLDNVTDHANILKRVNLRILAGQFVALVGPSGAGKSTLAKIIAGLGGLRRSGTMSAGEADCDLAPNAYRCQIGYVAQEGEAFRDLTAEQTVQFGARLRGGAARRDALSFLRRRFDIKRHSWRRLFETLSGGEKKRVLMAVEFARRPRLLVLDEPTSGLDTQRERDMMHLLRGLSYQGCTVILVTHGLASLSGVDRVIGMREGKISYDGPPQRFRWDVLDGSAAAPGPDPPLPPSGAEDCPLSATQAASSVPQEEAPAPRRRRRAAPVTLRGVGRQFGLLLQREITRLRNAPVKRLGIAVGVLPLVFAAAIAVAVPASPAESDRALLGFLSVLACIWMGASLSLMGVVDEVGIIDHERLLFLHWGCYVGSKWLATIAVALVQTLLFAAWLVAWRSLLAPETMLLGVWPWGGLCLLLAGWAAVGLGLFISATAAWLKRRESASVAASLLLALAMMWQILFSVQVAGTESGALHEAYRQFHLHRCTLTPLCREGATHWEPDRGGWLCDNCYAAWKAAETKQGAPVRSSAKQQREEQLSGAAQAIPPTHDHSVTPASNRLAVALSYSTISRYADIALRTFAYDDGYYDAFARPAAERSFGKHEAYQRHAYARWRRWATFSLGAMVLGFPLLAWLMLVVRERLRQLRAM